MRRALRGEGRGKWHSRQREEEDSVMERRKRKKEKMGGFFEFSSLHRAAERAWVQAWERTLSISRGHREGGDVGRPNLGDRERASWLRRRRAGGTGDASHLLNVDRNEVRPPIPPALPASLLQQKRKSTKKEEGGANHALLF